MKITDPSFNYDRLGQTYSSYRQADPRIAAYLDNALGSARTILNVGAGSGSYEPADRYVIAVEPSSVMRSQRQSLNKVPAVIGRGDALPFDDQSFDACMALLTLHHWPDMGKGLWELKRVARRVIIMTFDPNALDDFWNVHYFPGVIEIEKRRYPTVDFIVESLGGKGEIIPVPVPLDCTDGFQEAFYGRPEAFLQKEVRLSQSAWGFLPPGLETQYVEQLRKEILSGDWDRKYGHLRTQPYFNGALRLIVYSSLD